MPEMGRRAWMWVLGEPGAHVGEAQNRHGHRQAPQSPPSFRVSTIDPPGFVYYLERYKVSI
jgi:hypothetical protein